MNLKINTLPQINYYKLENNNLKSFQPQLKENSQELCNIGYTDLVFRGNLKIKKLETSSALTKRIINSIKFISKIPVDATSSNIKSSFSIIHNGKPFKIDINAKLNKNAKANTEYCINVLEEGKSQATEITMTLNKAGQMVSGSYSDEDFDKIIFSKLSTKRAIIFKDNEYSYDDKAKKCELINAKNKDKNLTKILLGNDLFELFMGMTCPGISIIKD